MSAAAPLRRPVALRAPAKTRTEAPAKTAAHARPRLVLVSQRKTTAGRLPFVILLGAVMVSGLVGVLLLHMFAAQDAFRVNTLQTHETALLEQEQQLAGVVDADSSPAALRAHAAALGMVATDVTKFHKLKDGRAIGVQAPVYVPPPVVAKATTTTTKTAGSKTTSKAAAKTGPTATTGSSAKSTSSKSTGTSSASHQ